MHDRRIASAFLLITISLAGCAWQKIPPPPPRVTVEPLPVAVGIEVSTSPVTNVYAPRVIEIWDQQKLFKKMIYPYREGDPVDGVIRVEIDGLWTGNASAGFLIGLTLGLASPFVGPSMDGNHRLQLTVEKKGDVLRSFSGTVATHVSWGLAANSSEVGRKTDDLLAARLAQLGVQLIHSRRHELVSSLQ